MNEQKTGHVEVVDENTVNVVTGRSTLTIRREGIGRLAWVFGKLRANGDPAGFFDQESLRNLNRIIETELGWRGSLDNDPIFCANMFLESRLGSLWEPDDGIKTVSALREMWLALPLEAFPNWPKAVVSQALDLALAQRFDEADELLRRVVAALAPAADSANAPSE